MVPRNSCPGEICGVFSVFVRMTGAFPHVIIATAVNSAEPVFNPLSTRTPLSGGDFFFSGNWTQTYVYMCKRTALARLKKSRQSGVA